MIGTAPLFIGSAVVILTAVCWQGDVRPQPVSVVGRSRHHHRHHHHRGRHRHRSVRSSARRSGDSSNTPRPKVALLLNTGVCDFVVAGRALVAKGRFDGRFFTTHPGTSSLSIKKQVAAWRPAAIVSFGREPDRLLHSWMGIPVVRLYRAPSFGAPTDRTKVGSDWYSLPFVAEPVRILTRLRKLSPRRIVIVGRRVSPWTVALHKLGTPGATIESATAESLVARLGEFNFRRGDVLVLTHEPRLFSSLVLLELVRLQLDQKVMVVGFSPHQVQFGLAAAGWYSAGDYGKAAADALVSYFATRKWEAKPPVLRWSYNETVQRALSCPKLGRPVSASFVARSARPCFVKEGRTR
ncbi:MAG: hypothetical protein J7M25_04160 [Deltaproteobacteria bacterium]|nr:hypothetical protein [Deltaproteobacteria bacterium]